MTGLRAAVDPAGSPHSSFPHRRVHVTPAAQRKLAGQHTTDGEADHEWKAEIRGATPVLRCARCKRIWWPDQRKPRTACVEISR